MNKMLKTILSTLTVVTMLTINNINAGRDFDGIDTLTQEEQRARRGNYSGEPCLDWMIEFDEYESGKSEIIAPDEAQTSRANKFKTIIHRLETAENTENWRNMYNVSDNPNFSDGPNT